MTSGEESCEFGNRIAGRQRFGSVTLAMEQEMGKMLPNGSKLI
jgi:hypothetical protein